MSGTDNYAHGEGLAAGYILGRLMPDRQPADVSERKRANLLRLGRGNRDRRVLWLHGSKLSSKCLTWKNAI